MYLAHIYMELLSGDSLTVLQPNNYRQTVPDPHTCLRLLGGNGLSGFDSLVPLMEKL